MLHGALILGVKVNLDQLGAINVHASALSHDFSGVDNVVEHVLVNCSHCAGAWTLLLLTAVLGDDLARGNDDDVLLRELLFNFANKTRLDLLERTEKRHWDKEGNSFLSTRDFDLKQLVMIRWGWFSFGAYLFGVGEIERLHFCSEFLVAVFDFRENFGNF